MNSRKLVKLFVLCSLFSCLAQAQTKSNRAKPKAPGRQLSVPAKQVSASTKKAAGGQPVQNAQPARAQSKKSQPEVVFARAVKLYQQNKFVEAAPLFYEVSRALNNQPLGLTAKFNFGLCMKKLGLRQTAAFAFINVTKFGDPELKKKAFDNLVSVANSLDEASLLNFALAGASRESLTETGAGVFEYRIGEQHFRNKKYDEAIASFQAALQYRNNWDDAIYSIGMAYLEKRQPLNAIPFFERLVQLNGNLLINNPRWATAILALARSYYQNRQWKDAIYTYRLIPKDNPLYRQTLMELSWALFRAGQLRSALSPLETLHTPYYGQFYDPESLILKSIILLFVCRYEEMGSAISTFETNYTVAYRKILDFLNTRKNPVDYFNEVEAALVTLENIKKTGELKSETNLPFMVMRTILEEHDVKGQVSYLKRLGAERKQLFKLFANSPAILSYGAQIIKGRRYSISRSIGQKVEKHLSDKVLEISDFVSQVDFLKYEKLNGERARERARMQVDFKDRVDSEISRSYYIQNGFRYWPFEGEYWRDELGNYQFVGENACGTIKR